MKTKRALAFILAILFVIGVLLSGCGKKASNTSTTSTSKEEKKTTQTTQPNVSNEPKFNKEKVLRLNGGWPKPPLYQGNPFANGGIGEAWGWMMERIYRYVRSTDKIYPWLAEDMPIHEGNKSTVKLRQGVTWTDGQPFTSKDVWAYYTLNNGEYICKFLKSIETPDDYTVVFVWNDPQPNDTIKTQLISQACQTQIPYHIYGKYVDKAAEILKQAKQATSFDKRGAFGIDIEDTKTADALNKNWQDFLKENPKFPIGTGPYKVVKVTASDMILEKRSDYWNADKVTFDKILVKMIPDAAGQYAMLRAGQLDRFDGTPPRDILESMLTANKDLLHYRMLDPSGIGFLFNIQKPPFDDVKFRRALVYAFDRTKIREVSNYYGTEVIGYSIMGMPLSAVDNWLLPEVKEKMTKFLYDPAKAEELLKEIGWSKGSDGIWRDKNGKQHNFIIGVNSGWVPGVNGGEVCAEQLTKFGMPTKLKAVDGSIYYEAAQNKHEYDMSIDWVDNTWQYSYAWWPLSNFYWGSQGKLGNFPRYKNGPKKDKLNIVLPGPDGKLIDIDKLLNEMVTMNNEDDFKKAASDLIWITSENAFGLDWFQNVTGTWFNMKTTKMAKGWPMEDQIQKYNRDMPLPTDPEDIERVAETNFGFAGNTTMMIMQGWMPN